MYRGLLIFFLLHFMVILSIICITFLISDRTIQTLSREEKKNEASKANHTNVDVAAEFNKAADTNLFEPPGK